jgi:hypothetical protein
VKLVSDAPNLKAYQMKELPSGEWEKVEKEVTLKLANKKHQYLFRTVNLAGVTGPEHKIVIESR